MKIGDRISKENLDYGLYAEYSNWADKNNALIKDMDSYYEIVDMHEPTEKELLQREKRELEQWLSAHDYIGTKIATGRATIEEYAEEIALMNEKAERINEIDRLLNE